ncbi:MAG: hypothetical protein AAGA70_09700 [Pseudomonadota bacterium]
MRQGAWLVPAVLLVLGACARSVPDDTGAGVGFGDYATYQQSRVDAQAALAGRPTANVLPPSTETVVPPVSAAPASDPIATRAAAAIDAAEAPPASSTSTASGPPPLATASGSTAISDEQDFEAVAARETIETDADRLARMAAERVEVAPTAVPDRPGSTGPNIVEYALATRHPVGQSVHRRSSFGDRRHEANCLSYQSADLAQQAFLAMGGPERDRQSLDPDGDGYACSWDPMIYRNAARGG